MIVIPGDPPLALVAPDLTPTQARWLLAVAWLKEKMEPVTIRRLAREMGRSCARSQQLVDKLTKRKYIKRHRKHAGTITLSKPLLFREVAQ